MTMNKSRTDIFLQYFEKLAPKYDQYRNRFSYYWNNIIAQTNYFISEDDATIEIGCGTGSSLAKINKIGRAHV